MCGILGFNFEDKILLKKGITCLSHRGPDAHGVFSDKGVSLGHDRLSIIDLSEKGKQPMSNEEGNIWITFNGEIYNYQELKEDLVKKGHSFKSDTDTEVIIHSYEEYGERCVEKFNGMWAFGIYDSVKKVLFLSRDRLGEKPLYYYLKNGKFIFATEIKAILPAIDARIDKNALDIYLSFGFIPEPFSIYQNVFKLKKGHNLSFNLKTKKLNSKKYWEIDSSPTHLGKIQIIKEVENLLDDSVRLRKIADVEVGTFLSGGIDSSTVSATLKKIMSKKLHSFSIGFQDKEFDESEFARKCAEYVGTEHHHYYFEQKDFEKLKDKLYYYYDEPFADFSMYPTYKVSEFARKHVKVCLSGDGGDELFGGYKHHKNFEQIRMLKKMPLFARKFGATISSGIENRKIEKINRAFKISLSSGKEFFYYFIDGAGQAYVGDSAKKLINSFFKKEISTQEVINWDLNYPLTDDFLVKVDRASMAHGLEVRVPFLDPRLVEFAAKIPLRYKVDVFNTKKILKKIAEKRIPKENVYRKKMGFGSPIAKWLFDDYKGDCLDKLKALQERKMISAALIRKGQDYLNSKEYNGVRGGYVYRLYGLELWNETWVG